MSNDPITRIIRFVTRRLGLRVLNLCTILIITGCGGSSNVQIGANFPTLITKPLDVKAGDLVLFGKWSGTEVKIDGQEYLIMKESDIMGVVQ